MTLLGSLRSPPCLALVLPCHNEAETLGASIARLQLCIHEGIAAGTLTSGSVILCVDDGSTDATWALIEGAAPCGVRGLKLSRNVGQQNALLAGLEAARTFDATITMDADLQDDPAIIPLMIEAWRQGHEVVYGVRTDRSLDAPVKRITSAVFYAAMRAFRIDIIPQHAEYRLLGKAALQALMSYEERNLFLRGLIPMLGFSHKTIGYKRPERQSGTSKYSLWRLVGLSADAITSLSVAPLRAIALAGLVVSATSLLAIVYVLASKFLGYAVRGWASVAIGLFFMGGTQMLCLGIVGEYVGRIYLETKRRPRFHVSGTSGDLPP